MSFGMQGLHVLRHAESDLTRQARQARGEFQVLRTDRRAVCFVRII